MKICEILFCFFFLEIFLCETKVFKQVKQIAAARSLHVEASQKYTEQMADLMQVRAEQLNLDRSLIQKDIERLKRDPLFKHKGVYSVIPIDKQGRLKIMHNIEQVINRSPAKLTNKLQERFVPRKPNPSQQKCGLWVQVGAMEFYSGHKQARAKLVFRSNCMTGPEVKYFIIKNQYYIPEYLQFKIGDKNFKVKYNLASFRSQGYGLSMKQSFTQYQLQSFFKIKFKLNREQKEDIRRKEIEINKQKCFDQCRRQRGHQRTICFQRCTIRHRYVKRTYRELSQVDNQNSDDLSLQKLDKESDKVQLEKGRKLEENEADQKKEVENKKIDGQKKERNLKLKTSENKSKKDRKLGLCQCRYCQRKKFAIERRYCQRACNARCTIAQERMSSQDRQFMHIGFANQLSKDEILSPGNHENQKGFFEYQVVDSIWNSSSVINANRRYESEQSMYMMMTRQRGRPGMKRLLKNRCVIYGTVA